MPCRYCDDDNQIKNICWDCQKSMIGKGDAMRIYGLSSNDLNSYDIFSTSYVNYYGVECNNYHPDDLYRLQKQIIDSLPDTSRKKNSMLGKKKEIDIQIERENQIHERIKQIKKLMPMYTKKLDNKYVGFYTDKIDKLIFKYVYEIDNNQNVCLRICLDLEELIKSEKHQNDLKIEKENRSVALCKLILPICQKIKYYKYAIEHSIFADFVNSGNIKDIGLAKEKLIEEVANLILIQRRTTKINKYLKEKSIHSSDIKTLYTRYIKGITCFDKIEERVNEIIKRKNLIFEKLSKEFDKKWCNFATRSNIYTSILNCKKSEINEKIEELKRYIIINIKTDVSKIHSESKKYYEEYMSGEITIDKCLEIFETISELYIIADKLKIPNHRVSGYHSNINLFKNNKITDIDLKVKLTHMLLEATSKPKYMSYETFRCSNPPGSGKLNKELKRVICESIFDVHKNKNNATIDNIPKEYLSFIKDKCEQLNVKYNIVNNVNGCISVNISKVTHTNSDNCNYFDEKPKKVKKSCM